MANKSLSEIWDEAMKLVQINISNQSQNYPLGQVYIDPSIASYANTNNSSIYHNGTPYVWLGGSASTYYQPEFEEVGVDDKEKQKSEVPEYEAVCEWDKVESRPK